MTLGDAFLEMLAAVRGAARNTLEAYRRDLLDLAVFLKKRGRTLGDAREGDLTAYLARLSDTGLASSTAQRRLSAIKQFHKFLFAERVRPDDPSSPLDGPRGRGGGGGRGGGRGGGEGGGGGGGEGEGGGGGGGRGGGGGGGGGGVGGGGGGCGAGGGVGAVCGGGALRRGGRGGGSGWGGGNSDGDSPPMTAAGRGHANLWRTVQHL